MSNVGRVVATGVLVMLWGCVNWFLNRAAPIVAANLAGKQFENNDNSYFVSELSHFFTGAGLPAVMLVALALAIWWKPLKGAFTAAAILVLLFAPSAAHAYYDKSDYAETYFILPNESAFYTPDVGANKTSQTKFGSEEYLAENKIAAKRFNLPHTKLENSGLFSNYYVPAGRLIIVDRTPYAREWVASEKRGTSGKDEGIHCQSKEGLDITVGISIGVSVLEENSPKYLFHFGTVPPKGDRTQPEVIFTSVFYARSLVEVMDGVGRNRVQTVICAEFASRTFNKGNEDAATIASDAGTKIKEELAKMGITLDFIGWGDTFMFDPTVQKAINDKYVAETLGPVMSTLQALADIRMKEGLGAGLAKRLPNTLLMPPDMMSALVGAGFLKQGDLKALSAHQ